MKEMSVLNQIAWTSSRAERTVELKQRRASGIRRILGSCELKIACQPFRSLGKGRDRRFFGERGRTSSVSVRSEN